MATPENNIFRSEIARVAEWADFSSSDVLDAVSIAVGPEARKRVEEQLQYSRERSGEQPEPVAE